ncbi:MAG: protein kinase, partial [Myxococcales bacterium]|nr:protein kinase [Myxococcales bacterium]
MQRSWGQREVESVGSVLAEKYRIEGVVAQGGMGTVYAATHLRLGRIVALKLLHPDYAHEEIYIKRFEREARRSAALAHPGIVEVHDFGMTEDSGPYLELELLQGASVFDVYERHGPLDPSVVLRIATQSLEALSAAHRNGVIHRDLKPANVFVVRQSDGELRIKLLDFGIAKVFMSDLDAGDATFTDALTKTGVVLGTLAYMSPEQFRDTQSVDGRADLFSLGATLFELLTGLPIVESDDLVRCVNAMLHGDYLRHPARVRPSLSAPLDAVVARALQDDPEDRYASALEMKEALEACPEFSERHSLSSLEADLEAVHGAAGRLRIGTSAPSGSVGREGEAETLAEGAETVVSGSLPAASQHAAWDLDAGLDSAATGEEGEAPSSEPPGPHQPSEAPTPSAVMTRARPAAAGQGAALARARGSRLLLGIGALVAIVTLLWLGRLDDRAPEQEGEGLSLSAPPLAPEAAPIEAGPGEEPE